MSEVGGPRRTRIVELSRFDASGPGFRRLQCGSATQQPVERSRDQRDPNTTQP